MLSICIAIIILAISVIILSLNCLRLDKRIHKLQRRVTSLEEDDYGIDISDLQRRIDGLDFERRFNGLEDLKADCTKLINYLVAKQGVSCIECIHRGVCDSNKTMCKGKSEHFSINFGNDHSLTIKPVGLCSKFVPRKDDTINGTAGPIE